MASLEPFVPLIAFVLAVLFVLLLTAPDRRAQLLQLYATAGNIVHMRHRAREVFLGLFTVKRAVYALILFPDYHSS